MVKLECSAAVGCKLRLASKQIKRKKNQSANDEIKKDRDYTINIPGKKRHGSQSNGTDNSSSLQYHKHRHFPSSP